jgi:ribonuclease BN (tRNA processing enzyme)
LSRRACAWYSLDASHFNDCLVRVSLLGTGGGPRIATTTSRAGEAIAVEAGGHLLLFDCGRRSAQHLADAGFNVLDVSRIFFTHLHSGHTVGYPDMVLSSWVGGLGAAMPARTDFKVYGPAGTWRLTDRLFGRDGAFKTDLRGMSDADLARREFAIHRHRVSLEWPAVHVTEINRLIGPGVVVSTQAWQVRAAFVSHGVPAVGYRIDAGGRSVVIGGDTAPCEGLVSLARGADVLVHEGAWHDDQIDALNMRGVHTSATGLGHVARRAGVKRVVVTGIPLLNDEATILEALAATIRRGFEGDVALAHDLMTLDV